MAKKSKVRTPNQRVPRVRYTAADLQRLRDLAERLGRPIPYQGYRSSFSLAVVAKERGLVRYLPKKATNKKEAFFEFIRDLHKEKPRTLKPLIRDILPRAIERRHGQGSPVLADEAHQLADGLLAMGVDLCDEIAELKLPTERPKIVPPPPDVQKALEAVGLHPSLLPPCRDLFLDGHINESVRKALEKFEATVQAFSGIPGKIGAELMGPAFSEKGPDIRLNMLATPAEQNEQEGYRPIAMGIMRWWRNELSHGDADQLPHHEALGRLLCVSNLLHRLDARVP